MNEEEKNMHKKLIKRKLNKRKKISIIQIIIFSIFILLFLQLLKINNVLNIKTNTKKDQKQENTKVLPRIGDVVYYNHKVPEDLANIDKLKVTFNKGSAEIPGTGVEGNQVFDASKENVVWKVWDVDETTGVVTLVSDRGHKIGEVGNAIGYIWFEYNLHRAASTMGYGYGADQDTNYLNKTSKKQEFTYKVGSGIESEPDNAKWKIGEHGIHKSGSRALTLDDVEEKLGITEEKKKEPEQKLGNSYPVYGWTLKRNIKYPQRKVKDLGITQEWENEKEAIGKQKSLDIISEGYKFEYKNVSDENEYKKIIYESIDEKTFEWYDLATKNITIMRHINYFGSAGVFWRDNLWASDGWVASYESGNWDPFTNEVYPRFATFLKSEISYYKDPYSENEWDITKPKSTSKNLGLKVTNFSGEDVNLNLSLKSDLPARQGRSDPAVENIEAKSNESVNKTTNVNIYSGIMRDGKYYEAKFFDVHNKYTPEITGIPKGMSYKIIGLDSDGKVDLEKLDNLEIKIYSNDYKVNTKYIGGENDEKFSVKGNLILKEGEKALSSREVTLKIGVENITIDNISIFNPETNEERNITVEFEKTDGSLHKVEYDKNIKKLVVTYNKEITVSVSEDSKKYLENISKINLKLVGGEEKSFSLNKNKSSITLVVPEKDENENIINYSLEKVGNIPGYYISIDGFNVHIKPVLKLPYTGTELSGKNIAIISIGMFGIAMIVRYRKKVVFKFKEYTIMK